jgi:putative hydrolase of the HAD superfamily
MRVRAVTLDLWGTLLHEDPQTHAGRTARRFELTRSVLDRPLSDAEIDSVHSAMTVRLEEFWMKQLDVSHRAQMEIYLRGLGVRLDPDRLAAFSDSYARATLDFPPRPDPSAVRVLETLSSRGLSLGLISNTFRTPGTVLAQILDRWGFLRFFTTLTFSDEALLRKPHPDIFFRTLHLLKADPAEAVHVGDDATADIAGAQSIGMRAIHLNDSVRLAEVPNLI